MRLRALQSHWDRFGRSDPLWAVLTQDDFRQGRNLDRFMASGRDEIDAVIELLENLGLFDETRRTSALDFGCGVGRCTQALSLYYRSVLGVDIAPSMIEEAQRLSPSTTGIEYAVNERPDLAFLDDDRFDLVYSNIVLQHIEPRYTTRYIREMVRIVRPNGAVIFQVPSRAPLPAAASPLATAKRWAREHGPAVAVRAYDAVNRAVHQSGRPTMEMFTIERRQVEQLLESCSARILEVIEDHSLGPGWENFRYITTK